MDNKTLGNKGENVAAEYLAAHGYRIRARNFRAPIGELDIIADQGGTIVFVEVKTRRGLKYGRPAQAVNYRKQQKIILTAQWFLQQENLTERACRFDVIEVYARPGGNWAVKHIADAFELT